MHTRRRTFTAFAAGLAATLSPWGRAVASSKPITIVCPYAPGGGTDTISRVMADNLRQRLGRTVLVENRAGASGVIGHQYVASAPPDGDTLLLGAIGPLAIAPHFSRLKYDPQRDLAPLTMGAMFPNVLIVRADFPAKNLTEFAAMARRQPGAISYASTGAGSAAHLAGELFNSRAGLQTVHTPYKGGGPALQDLLGGHISSYYASPASAIPHIESGKVRALAVTGLQRSPNLPDVPTIAESGYPGFSAVNWYCFMAPGKTPVPILDTLSREMVAILRDPAVRDELLRHGLTPQPSSRQELAATIASESATWGQIIRERKITAE